MACTNSLRLATYNCRGWNSGLISIVDILPKIDVCLIQKHWLLDNQLSKLSVDSDFTYCGISGMDSSTMLSGRPFGGCAILYRKSLLGCVSTLNCPSSRFCAVSITDTKNRVSLLICVYLPTLSSSPSCNEDFIFALSELEGFINAHNFDQLIIGGDLNVDFSRPSRNRDCLVELMSSLDLLALDVTLSSVSNNIGFTYMKERTVLLGLGLTTCYVLVPFCPVCLVFPNFPLVEIFQIIIP